MDKTQYMLDNFKRAYPVRAARLEREWEEKQVQCAESVPTTPKIDWTKPLVPASTARQIANVEYVGSTWFENKPVYVCKLMYRNYAENGYEYYVMYDEYGRTLGKNAGTANIKNKAEEVTRHYAISKSNGDVVATAVSHDKAWMIAQEKGYNYTQLTFTSHTFTR